MIGRVYKSARTGSDMSAELKVLIKEWVSLDDQIKESVPDMKAIRQRHKELKGSILKHMEDESIGTCNIMGGEQQICLNYREKKIRPNKADILRKMAEQLRDKNIASDLYDYVFEKCETESVVSLNRKMTAKGKKRKKEMEMEEDGEEEEGGSVVK